MSEGVKLTRLQKEFIGTTFETPKSGVLTVTGLHSRGKHMKFYVECSICSKDKELFPLRSLISTKGHLITGRTPCGCSATLGGKSFNM